LWATACDPTSSAYGQVQARLEWNERLERMALVRVDRRPGWGEEAEDEDASVMCDVRACHRASFESWVLWSLSPRCSFRRSSIKDDIKTLKLSRNVRKHHLMNCRLAVQLRGPESVAARLLNVPRDF
jgi:hypothetical protein